MDNSAQTLRNFAFSDGQYLAHFTDGDSCVMDYRNWREELFRFVFSGVALIHAYGGSISLCDAFVATNSDLIHDARRVLADDWGTSGGPKDVPLVELSISDDVPVFSIVFTNLRIIGPIPSDRCMTIDSIKILGDDVSK